MKRLFVIVCLVMTAVTGCEEGEMQPGQGTRPVGDAGGDNQVFGTNAVNDPAGANRGPGQDAQPQE